MTPEEAVTKIKATCDDISKATLQINPAIRALDNEALRDELLQTVYRLTIELETIKKALRKKSGPDRQLL
ncbi:MAG: hypothetical protein ISQ14_02520 [Verrucomicrobiae bacterium]|jgi:prefoldin subunit 5|nr:hypothetical protein [Verrucomicrobiae bacterium]